MYISCPQCETRFVINPGQIGAGGRRVKCSKCAHIWLQKLSKDIKIEPLLTSEPIADVKMGSGVNLPALLPIRIPVYLYTMPALLIMMIIAMLIMMFPAQVGLKTMLTNKHINIKDIQITNQKDIEKITVSYKVLNTSDKETKMPLIRIQLYDKNNRVLKSCIVDKSKIELSPKQYVLLKTEFIPAPPSTESIDIMIGNKLDFLLR